jgi:putative FmdB family regulatory protein
MPIYEFACRSCEHRFEELVKVNGAAPAVDCPHCGSAEVTRLLSTFAVRSGSSTTDWSAPADTGGGCCGGACGCH